MAVATPDTACGRSLGGWRGRDVPGWMRVMEDSEGYEGYEDYERQDGGPAATEA